MENSTKGNKKEIDFIRIIVVIFLFGIFFYIVSFNFSDEKKKDTVTNKEKAFKIESSSETIKYKEGRLKALKIVQSYKIKEDINDDNPRYEVLADTELSNVFILQNKSGYINSNGKWIVVKDNERFVVIYKSSLFYGGPNNPQWSIVNGNMKALNGTALEYTPELGYQNPKLDEDSFTKARKLYLRWMEISDDPKYYEALNGDDSYLRDVTEEKITAIVANEFDVSTDEADDMFIEGLMQNSADVKKANSERGDILSDEKIEELLNDQGNI